MAWLFNLNRCPTRDRLINCGHSVDPNCLLCNTAPESRDHLLFQCSCSWEVWSQTATRCQITPPRDWASLLPFMNGLTLPKNHKKLILLAWQCTIYLLWSERNSRLHRGCFRSSQSLLGSLDLIVRNRCSSYRDTNPTCSSTMLQLWLYYCDLIITHPSISFLLLNSIISDRRKQRRSTPCLLIDSIDTTYFSTWAFLWSIMFLLLLVGSNYVF